MFAKRIKNVTTSGIREVFDLAKQLPDPINLSIGQPDFPVPNTIKRAAIEAIESDKSLYTVTQGQQELCDKITAYITSSRGKTPEKVFVSSGVSGGLLLALLVLVNQGDEILVPDPYFVAYKNLAHLVEATPVYYNLYPDFRLQPEKIEALITEKTKILIINSPCNPTGVVFEDEALQKVAALAARHDLVVISDEIYSLFVYQQQFPSIFRYYPKTILLDGFSKSYGMPGWRMGYVAGPGDILEKMITLQQFSFVCAPSIAQYACVHIFEEDMTKWREIYRQRRDLVCQQLTKSGYQLTCPGGTFYAFPKIPWGKDATEFCKAALEENLLLIPGNSFSQQNTHFRLSFAVEESKLRKGLEILDRLAKQVPPKKKKK